MTLKKEFRVELGAYRAVLMYAKQGDTLDLYHIYVPDPFRGRTVAGKILVAAFKYAQKEGLKVVATCPFIAQDFLEKFPQFQKGVSPGEFPFVEKTRSP
ncbi:MAG: GNAT family N-acetyltransferase [Candidatus Omnitrophota bacterium]